MADSGPMVHAAPVPWQQKIDSWSALQHFLQTLAFCLAIGSLQYYFSTSDPYQVPLVYSISTGVPIWFLIEFGSLPLTQGTADHWPRGARGLALIAGAIVVGFFVGRGIGDWWFGWSTWEQGRDKIVSSLVISLVAGAVVTSWFYLRGRSAGLLAEAQTAQRQAAESRLKLLQSQLDPHMLFNTLANLRSLIDADPPRAIAMLDRLNDYLRATLSASRTTMHPLSAEFDRLRDYLELMAIRMGPRLRFSLAMAPELASLMVPTLLLQPLVENSIKHGLEPSITGGWVDVRAWLDDDGALRLDVTDSGTGLLEALETSSNPGLQAAAGASHFGLAQVRERLATQYGDAARLSVASTPARLGLDPPAQVAAVRIARSALAHPAESVPAGRIEAPALPI